MPTIQHWNKDSHKQANLSQKPLLFYMFLVHPTSQITNSWQNETFCCICQFFLGMIRFRLHKKEDPKLLKSDDGEAI